MRFRVSNIMWDKEVDGEIQNVDLPSCVEVWAEDADSAVDVASDMTGYCIFSATVVGAGEYVDDWYCRLCNHGPMSDGDDQCPKCGTKHNQVCEEV